PISTLPLLRLLTRLAILAFSFHAPAPTEIYTLSLHDALPIFLNIQDFPFLIETRNTIALRILHIITKDDRLSFRFHLLFRCEKQILQSCPVKDIIAEYQTHIVRCNKLLSNNKGLSQTFWFGLLGVGNRQSELLPVTKQALKIGQVFGCRYNQYFPDTG